MFGLISQVMLIIYLICGTLLKIKNNIIMENKKEYPELRYLFLDTGAKTEELGEED